MNSSQVRSKLIMGIIVALFFGIALFLRTYFPYDRVFGSDWIKFTSNDAYYHMRLVDNLVHNFPHLSSFDPYSIYPDGGGPGNIRFFDWLLASIIWVIGWGAPTEHTIDVVGAYFPAVLGALTVIPVYFIGRELFGRWAGVLAAGLIALLPGEFLGRSILGFTDHHVAETLFTTVAILFLILAIKTASQRQLTFGHLKRRDWTTSLKPVIYSLLAAIFLGVYIFTFLGALLFIFIIFVYFVIQFIIDHLKGKSTDYLCLVGVSLFSITLIFSLLISAGRIYSISLITALLTLASLSAISRLMTKKKIKPAYYPLTLVGLGIAGLGLFYLVSPTLLSSMLSLFSIFRPTGASLTTIETQPFLFPQGNLSFAVASGNFPGLLPHDPKVTGLTFRNILSFMTTTFFLSFIALGILIYLVIKQGSTEKTLVVVWSLVIVAATLGQRRFAYYLAVNVALLIGYLSWQVLSLVGFKELTAKIVETPRKAAGRRASPKKSGFDITLSRTVAVLEVLILFFVIFFWNIQPAIETARRARFAPSDAWLSALSWMKENTPEPFDNPDFYYQLEASHNYRSRDWLERSVPNPSGDPDFYSQLAAKHKYPESAYGVVAWWDYGYWITRVAHRIPVANPSQDPKGIIPVASFFTSQDEKSAKVIIGELDSPYIIIDSETAVSKFWAITVWAGKEQTEFFEVLLVPEENRLVAKSFIYPGYYRSLSTRLYNFDGKAVTPEGTLVISYEERTTQGGEPIKIVTDSQTFPSYEEAEAYLSNQESGNHQIVGTNPFISPVPLEALENYKLIYGSDDTLTVPDAGTVPAVKIFEYLD
ncbi:MAG: oligosaccharyl transferase, archaeosortase A system-associated [Chloroflexi bacterium]|nr:oligosaccharyl transferase, archaeosortase A system-associated [Chloroflexota bacterium]